MSAESFAKIVIWLAAITAPYFVLATGNAFSSRSMTSMRALLAVAVGWCLTIAYVTAAQAINISVATQNELLALYENDGAPAAFAAVLGWLPAMVTVAFAWLFHAVVLPRLRGERSNIFKRTRVPRAA